MIKCEVFGVYLIDFKINEGGELSNKHYGLILTKMSSSDKTFLVAPMTSKKRNKRTKGGSWKGYPENCRVSSFSELEAIYGYNYCGFRIVRTI